MKRYPVEIKETLSIIVNIEAHSSEEAEEKASRGYYKGDHILYPDDYQGVEFNAIEEAA